MLCTDELNAKLLCRQHEEAISNLTAENEKYDRIKVAITQFVEDPTIDSCGIRALKRQLEDYILIIDAIKSANDTDIQEYTQANAFIGDEYLFGRVVTLRRTRRALKVISDDRADYYWGLYRDSLSNPLDSGDYYRERAEHYDKESAAHQAVIDECTRIIDKYDSIENSTYGLLNAASQYRRMIIEAILTMGQAFDGQNYNSYVNNFWRGSLSIDSAKCVEELYEFGVTADQIANMEEKGFSPEEILEYVKFCEEDTNIHSETDRAFLDALMSKDYEKAFQAYPTDLSEEMYIILTDYAIHLQPYDDNYHFIGDEQELTDFLNAAWSAKGCYPMVKGDDEDPDWLPNGEQPYFFGKMTDYANERAKYYTDVLSTMDPTDDGYYEQLLEYYSSRSAVDLWSTQYAHTQNAVNDLNPSVANLDMHRDQSDGQISYDLSYYNGRADVVESIVIESERTGVAISMNNDYIDLLVSRKKYEDAKNSNNLIKIAGKTTVGAYLSYAKKEAVDVLKQLGMSDTRIQALLFTISLGKNFDIANMEESKAKKELEKKQRELSYNWVGSGTTYTVKNPNKDMPPKHLVACDRINPGELRTMTDWYTHGIDVSYLSPNENRYDLDAIYDKIEADEDVSDDNKRICYYLLKGADDTHTLEELQEDLDNGVLDMELFYGSLTQIQVHSDISIDKLEIAFQTQAASYGYFPD